MFSGLERQRTAASRGTSVAWAWIKARGTKASRTRQQQPNPRLTDNILSRASCDVSQVENWRDRLAVVSHQKLARQICDRFYNFAFSQSWRSPAAAVATSRMLSPALPAYCTDDNSVKHGAIGAERYEQARILASVLTPETGKSGAVLIPLRPKAA